jgi:hypothetical protein
MNTVILNLSPIMRLHNRPMSPERAVMPSHSDSPLAGCNLNCKRLRLSYIVNMSGPPEDEDDLYDLALILV